MWLGAPQRVDKQPQTSCRGKLVQSKCTLQMYGGPRTRDYEGLSGQIPPCGLWTQSGSHQPTWRMCTIVNRQWMQRRWDRLQSAESILPMSTPPRLYPNSGKHKNSGTWLASMFSDFFFSFFKIVYWRSHSRCILTLVFSWEFGAFRWSHKLR